MGAVLYTMDGRLACPLCYTKADVLAARRRAGFDRGGVALAGAIATGIPLLVRAAAALLGVARAVPPDHVALVGGIVAMGCGGWTVMSARARASGGWLALGAAVAVLGAYHVARGVGLVG